MTLETERLILRHWEDADAEELFKYASDPDVGPIAGWDPHKSVEESREIIKNVLNGRECYAICLKGGNSPIGCAELMLKGHNVLTEDECELGYWLGKPFWGRGYMTEAARELIRHGFDNLGMARIWCGYFDGNEKSKRVQEKCGFKYHHTNENIFWELTGDIRTEHVSVLDDPKREM